MKAIAKKRVSALIKKGDVLIKKDNLFILEGYDKSEYITVEDKRQNKTFIAPNSYNEETINELTEWFEIKN